MNFMTVYAVVAVIATIALIVAVDRNSPARRSTFVARGMLAGLLGSIVAALLAPVPISLAAAAMHDGMSLPDKLWMALVGAIAWIGIVGIFGYWWLMVGLLIGGCFGFLVGPKSVDRRHLLWAAGAGTLLVAAPLGPVITAGPLIWQTVIAIPAGLVGGIAAALAYRRLCATTTVDHPVEQREAASM